MKDVRYNLYLMNLRSKTMTNLINGKEALIALANGEEVEFKDGMD